MLTSSLLSIPANQESRSSLVVPVLAAMVAPGNLAPSARAVPLAHRLGHGEQGQPAGLRIRHPLGGLVMLIELRCPSPFTTARIADNGWVSPWFAMGRYIWFTSMGESATAPSTRDGVGLDLLLNPQLVQGVHHLVEPYLKTQVDGRHVEGAGERLHQRYALAELAIVVLRRPDLAILTADADRLVLERRAQGQAVGEAGEIDRRFHQGAYLATGIQAHG